MKNRNDNEIVSFHRDHICDLIEQIEEKCASLELKGNQAVFVEYFIS